MEIDELFFEVRSDWLFEDELRLNASSYSIKSIKARSIIDNLKDKGFDIFNLKDIVKEIFYPGRFKRNYSKKGTLFLSSKEIFKILPEGKRIKDISSKYLVEKNWILLTRSGTVGRVSVVNDYLSQVSISEHVIRIIPKEDSPIGFIYAFLLSDIGQALLLKDIFGGVVDEIEPHHLERIPIPIIKHLVDDINKKMISVIKLRNESQQLLLKSIEMLNTKLNLIDIDEEDLNYYGEKEGKLVKAFEMNSEKLDLRMDAPYYAPFVQEVRNGINSSDFDVYDLGDLVKEIILPPRFKRPYVENIEDGVPFISGTDLTFFKPLNAKYLWKGFSDLDMYLISKNWILISARGTVGRAYLVTDATENWTASDNIVRCIVNEDKILPAYLTLNLMSKYVNFQIQANKAGSVQDLLQPIHLEDVQIIVPNLSIQKQLGNILIEALEKRDKANQLEDETIRELEIQLLELIKN